jgi:hypothetical protein
MADDLGISYESLQKALWFAAKNGMDVNVDSMAKLADQYVSLESGSEKAEFLAKNFGKSGAEMGKLLEQGSQGVYAANAAIKGNLVLTEQAVKNARDYEIAVDGLNDAWDGTKVAIGGVLVVPITHFLQNLNKEVEQSGTGLSRFDNVLSSILGPLYAVVRMTTSYSEETKVATGVTKNQDDAMTSVAEATGKYATAIDDVDYSNLLSTTMNIQDAMTGFAEKSAEINGKIAELDPTTADYAEKLNGLEGELKENAAAQELWSKKLVYSMVQAKLAVGGINSGEFAFLIELGVQMGLVDQKSADMAQNLNKNIDSLDFTNAETAMSGVKGAYLDMESGLNKSSTLSRDMNSNMNSLNFDDGVSSIRDVNSAWQQLLDMPDNVALEVVLSAVTSGFPDGGNGGPLCFVAGTPVSIPGGTRAIEDVKVGHFVSVKAKEEVIRARVTRLVSGTKPQVVEISTSDGQIFHCTPEHPWQLEDGNFVFASNLNAGDRLNSDHGEVYVLDTNLKIGDFKVYTFEVDHPDHTYMVGGLVVHNKTFLPVNLTATPQSSGFYSAGSSLTNSTVNSGTVNSGTTIIVNNPVFNVGSGRGVVEVLEALR